MLRSIRFLPGVRKGQLSVLNLVQVALRISMHTKLKSQTLLWQLHSHLQCPRHLSSMGMVISGLP